MMRQRYRSMMEQVALSDEAKVSILDKIEQREKGKRKVRPLRIVLIAACVCLLLGSIAAFAADEGDVYFLLGKLYRRANEDDSTVVLAEYGEHKIYRSVVDYYRDAYLLGDPQNKPADREIVQGIIENIILREEAERLGLSATEEEVEEMYQASRSAYDLPDGKEQIDAMCAGMGLTVEEYYARVREQLPDTITRQKLKDAAGRAYCEEHGLEFTKVNQPQEVRDAVEQYIADLFEAHEDEIVYHWWAFLR